jgi:hypothetical protein
LGRIGRIAEIAKATVGEERPPHLWGELEMRFVAIRMASL